MCLSMSLHVCLCEPMCVCVPVCGTVSMSVSPWESPHPFQQMQGAFLEPWAKPLALLNLVSVAPLHCLGPWAHEQGELLLGDRAARVLAPPSCVPAQALSGFPSTSGRSYIPMDREQA